MKKILITVAISLLCCVPALAQGGGGESTTKEPAKRPTKQREVTSQPAVESKGNSNPTTNSPSTPTVAATGELRFGLPDGWVSEHPGSTMRVAQFSLPKFSGDPEDASLMLFYFGEGKGGPVDTNIDRWIGQMEQPDGHPSKERARIQASTINGLRVTMVDLTGTYVAQLTPNSAPRHDANYRMRAAVIETPKGNYFLKLIGPEKTIDHWNQSFDNWMKSFEFK